MAAPALVCPPTARLDAPKPRTPSPPADDLVEVRLEMQRYVQITLADDREVDVLRRRGDVFQIPRRELARMPYAFKATADIDKENAAAAQPKEDRTFQKLREAARAALDSLAESKRLQAAADLEAAQEAARSLGVET